MSLYGTKASAPVRGPRSVWPWFFMSVGCVLVYAFAALSLWPWGYPEQDELVSSGGDIRRIIIRDSISDTGAGSMLPTHVSVYITFRDIDGEFEFPWSHPGYYKVRDRVGVYADVLVEKSALDGPGPYTIWALEESNTYKPDDQQTSITYAEIASQLDNQQETLADMLRWLGGAGVVFFLWGWHTVRWNRRNYPPISP